MQRCFIIKLCFIISVFSPILEAGCDFGPQIENEYSMGFTIICFGNSITAGYGVEPQEVYPFLLSRKLGQPVINAGISGQTTYEALERLGEDVLHKKPRLVILELGTNDYAKDIPKEETFKNIDEIVRRIQEEGAMVAITTTIRLGVLQDTYLEGFQDIAKKRKAIFIPHIMEGVTDNSALSFDTMHPNAHGHEIIAERIYQAIRPLVEYKAK